MVDGLGLNVVRWLMKFGVAAVVVILLGAATTAAACAPPLGTGMCAVTKTANMAVPMRDGAVLRADVYRPTTSRPVPVILMRTQYGKEDAQVQPSRYQRPDWFASYCYLVVVQDIPGQFASAGTFSEFSHDCDDGYDSVEWAAKLPGSSGKVGMYGSSYVGATQWLAAEAAPPHLTTVVPANTASDYFNGWTYENGAFRLNFIEPWTMNTIALSAAKNRGDTKVTKQLTQDNEDIATWVRYTPYRSLVPTRSWPSSTRGCSPRHYPPVSCHRSRGAVAIRARRRRRGSADRLLGGSDRSLPTHARHAPRGESATHRAGHPAGQGRVVGRHRSVPDD
jgi:hypothetical protein